MRIHVKEKKICNS